MSPSRNTRSSVVLSRTSRFHARAFPRSGISRSRTGVLRPSNARTTAVVPSVVPLVHTIISAISAPEEFITDSRTAPIVVTSLYTGIQIVTGPTGGVAFVTVPLPTGLVVSRRAFRRRATDDSTRSSGSGRRGREPTASNGEPPRPEICRVYDAEDLREAESIG